MWLAHDRHELKQKELEETAMKYLSLVPVAIFSLALQGQTNTSAGGTVQSGKPATSAAASVSAELTKRIDTKKAKVGDEVDVKTTSTAKLPDGTELPKGTKLVGKVTDVRARSNTDKTSHLAFDLDRAVTRDGHELPVRAAVTSMMAAVQPADNSAVMSGGGSGGGGMGAGGGGGSSSGSGGTASAPASAPVMSSSEQPADSAQVAKGAQDRVPVANMPGVVLTSADGVSNAGLLDAANQNISLETGTKMTLNVVTGQK
jgi:hypothetical protein